MVTIEEALSYLRLGWSVIPCGRDKKALVSWSEFQKTRPTEKQAERWWGKDFVGANIALITGKISNMVVIDIDSPRGEEAYASVFGEVHKTIRQSTGKNGAFHLFFSYPEGYQGNISNLAKTLEDVDARGDGGYVLIDPSVHPSGKPYKWLLDPREGIDDLLPLPREILAYFWPPGSQTTKSVKEFDIQKYLEGVNEGERDMAATRVVGYYLRKFEGDKKMTEEVCSLWNDRNRPPMELKQLKKVINSISGRQEKEEAENSVGHKIKEIVRRHYADGTDLYNIYVEGKPGYLTLTPSELADQTGFLSKFMAFADVKLTRRKAVHWDRFLNTLFKEIKVVEAEEDETLIGLIRQIIQVEADRNNEDLNTLHLSKFVVVPGGYVCFKLQALIERLKYSGEKVDSRTVGLLLRRMNACHVKKSIGNVDTRCWQFVL